MKSIEIEDVEKTYPDGTQALKSIDMEIEEGELFGFLGPNGAGKTTLIDLMATRLRPDSGKISINGFSLPEESREVRKSIGYMSQEISVDDELTARENLVFACRSYGIKPDRERIDRLLELVGLKEVHDRKPKKFSVGMRKRLDAATAIVHEPPVVFLDEPTTGLDPSAKERLWDYFEEINERGTTVFLTTQNLKEAERLAERIALIENGEIVRDGTPEELKSIAGEDTLEFKTDRKPEDVIEILLDSSFKEKNVRNGGDSVKIKAEKTEMWKTVQMLEEKGVKIHSMSRDTTDLDDVFLSLTGGKDA